jgi:hypothetical protein
VSDDYRQADLPKFEEPPSLPPDQPAVRTKVDHLGRTVPPTNLARFATALAIFPFAGLVSCALVPAFLSHAMPFVAAIGLGLVGGVLGIVLGLVDAGRGGSAGQRAAYLNLGLLAGIAAMSLIWTVVVLTH